jgi:prevent-host-death family protein
MRAMDRIIGVTELQRRFRSVFDEVVHGRVPYILTRGSRPEAVLIPYEQYRKFVQADQAGVLERFDRSRALLAEINARFTDEEIEADLRDATRIVRARRRRESGEVAR